MIIHDGFGRVLSGGVSQAALTVLNRGDQPLAPPVATLVESSGATPPGFSIDNGCTVPTGFEATCALNINFQPAQSGFPVALLRLASAGGNASAVLYAEVTSGGTVVLAAAADQSPNFGDVGLDTSKTVQFPLSNPGTAPTGRLSITASSPLLSIDPGDYNASGQGLASGSSCGFSVTYTPQAAEAVTATLSIQSPGAGGAALSLTGQGRSHGDHFVTVSLRELPGGCGPRRDRLTCAMMSIRGASTAKAGWVCLFFGLAWAGCAVDSTTLVEPVRAEQGSVALPLRTETNGIAYRLRAANFDVTGPESLTLHTDDAPDTLVLRHPLQVGDYQVELLDGWHLERQLGTGFEDVSASLLSPKLQSVSIARDETTSLAYDFRTEQAVIGFNDGDLALSIGVQDSELCGSGGKIEKLDDGDPCTIDRCDAVSGVVHELVPDAGPDCRRCSTGADSPCCNCTGPALGQGCNVQANNCSVGSCVAGTCQCSGNNPNACGGNRCVNFQTDGANCGGCGNNCGALGCNGRGQCNCPGGQTFSAGSCRLNDGQQCSPNGTPCVNGCTQWFTDSDGDGFGNSGTAINRCGTTPPGAGFVRQGGDCCDSDPNANPGQTESFARVRNGCGGGDFNCDGREDKTFRDVGGGSDILSTNGAATINGVLANVPTCEDLGGACNPSNVTLIWPGGQVPPCGATGAQGTGGSQCFPTDGDGICHGISGFGVDVFCR